MRPVALCIRRDRRSSPGLAVRQQLHRDLLRADAVAVVIVHPLLRHLDFGGLGLVGIGEGKAVGCLAADLSGISIGQNFLDGVLDFLALVFVHGQARKGMRPVALCIRRDRRSFPDLAVRQQLHRDLLRADAVAVVVVHPLLRHLDFGGLGRVGVGKDKPVLGVALGPGQRIAVARGIFLHGIGDLFTALVLVQVFKGVLPTVARVQLGGLAVQRLAVSIQANRDFSRPDAVLVVGVVPVFGYGNAGLAGGVGVGDVVVVVGGAVVVNLFFLDGIGHLFSVAVYRQILETPVPGIAAAAHRLGIHQFAICQQVDGDGIRAFAVLVVGVVPGLGPADAGGLQRVGDGEPIRLIAADLKIIPGHRSLLDGVFDLGAVFVFGQVCKFTLPVVGFVQRQGVYGRFAVVQGYGDPGIRPVVVRVVRVALPHLFHRDFNGLRRVGVGDGDFRAVGRRSGSVAFRYRHLGYRVHDILAVRFFRQIAEGMRPGFTFQRDRFTVIRTVRFQLHRDLVGSFAVLVIAIVPLFRHRNLREFRRVGVGQIVIVGFRAAALGITVQIAGFYHAVLDLRLVLILRQVGKAVVQFGAGDRGRLAIHIFPGIANLLLQLHRDLVRAHAGLVVIVVPGLGTVNVNGLRRVGVGNSDFRAVGRRSGSGSRVIAVRYRHLGYRVHDILAVRFFRQIAEGMRPGFTFQRDRFTVIRTVRFQLHRDLVGSFAVLVIAIVPLFRHRNLREFRRVGVGQIVIVGFRAAALGITVQIAGFYHAVLDLRLVLILRQVGKAVVQFGAGDRGRLAIHIFPGIANLLLQLHRDLVRAHAGLVVIVVPGLGTVNVNGLRRIGDGKAILHIAADFGFVPGHRDFLDGVLDFAVIVGLRQAGKLALPAVVRGQLQRLFRLAAALAPQFNRDALRVVAVRGVLVGPDLLDRNADLCIGIFVGDLVLLVATAAGVGDAVDLQFPGGRVLAYLHSRRDSARLVGPAGARRGFLDGIDVAARFLIRDRVKDGFAIRCAVRCRRFFRQRGAVLCRDGKRKHAIRQRRQRAACSGLSVFLDPERGVRAVRIGGNTGDHDRHLVGSNGQYERFSPFCGVAW